MAVFRRSIDLAAEAFGLREPLRNHVADDHHRGSQQLASRGAGKTHRTGSGNIDGRAWADARGDRAVISGRENIGKQGQIQDLRHRLILIRELQQVEIRVRHHDVLGLAADPSAHIDVAVGRARPSWIHGQADAGLPLPAIPAASAGDVERYRHQVADTQHLDVIAFFDDLSRDFVS